MYRQRNFIERLVNEVSYFRGNATSYDKLDLTFLAMTNLACIRLRLGHNESKS